VRAELAAVEGDALQAMELYDEAIACAQSSGFIHHQALANELCARFHLDANRSKVARAYLAEAYYAYQRWGAATKVEQLRTKYPELVDVVPFGVSAEQLAGPDSVMDTSQRGHGPQPKPGTLSGVRANRAAR
jgi:hypothetical protein